MKSGWIFLLILVSVLLVSGGCNDGITGNATSDSTISDDIEHMNESDTVQKKAKTSGSGHEQVCY